MTGSVTGIPADSTARAALAADLAATHALVFPPPQVWASREFDGLLDSRGILLTGDAESYVLGRVMFDEAEILTLATHPDRQRQGLARKALAAFEHQAARMGAKTVFLEVSVRNLAASRLYSVAGYIQVGCRKGYYVEADGTRSDALVLSKAVGG